MAMVLYPPKAQKGEARSGRRMESWLLVADLDYFQARPVWQSQSGSLAPWGMFFFAAEIWQMWLFEPAMRHLQILV